MDTGGAPLFGQDQAVGDQDPLELGPPGGVPGRRHRLASADFRKDQPGLGRRRRRHRESRDQRQGDDGGDNRGLLGLLHGKTPELRKDRGFPIRDDDSILGTLRQPRRTLGYPTEPAGNFQ